jgi:hypothetical protein
MRLHGPSNAQTMSAAIPTKARTYPDHAIAFSSLALFSSSIAFGREVKGGVPGLSASPLFPNSRASGGGHSGCTTVSRYDSMDNDMGYKLQQQRRPESWFDSRRYVQNHAAAIFGRFSKARRQVWRDNPVSFEIARHERLNLSSINGDTRPAEFRDSRFGCAKPRHSPFATQPLNSGITGLM